MSPFDDAMLANRIDWHYTATPLPAVNDRTMPWWKALAKRILDRCAEAPGKVLIFSSPDELKEELDADPGEVLACAAAGLIDVAHNSSFLRIKDQRKDQSPTTPALQWQR
jgi:hypothetical protein